MMMYLHSFCRFTNEPKTVEGNFQETWFYPKIDARVDIESRKGVNEKEILTLTELKKLFDYLKCDKQLLFTEAGLTENFKREFVKSHDQNQSGNYRDQETKPCNHCAR
jgi:hypothetical protein